MTTEQFDEQFRKLYTAMVEIAFEFVNFNKEEIDAIYVYGSMEVGFFYNTFYKVNGNIVKISQLNAASKLQYDVGRDKVMNLLEIGIEYLQRINALFKMDGREVPTLLKLTYNPKTGKFNNDISYDLHYSNSNTRHATDVFNEWFAEMGGTL